jgi:hypothetical protein
MRLLWHDFIVHGLLDRGSERCEDCGRPTDWETGEPWHTTNEEWERVMGGPWGLLCRPCFASRTAPSVVLLAVVTPTLMPDGSRYPGLGLYDVRLSDGRTLDGLAIEQVVDLASREEWTIDHPRGEPQWSVPHEAQALLAPYCRVRHYVR